MTRPDSKRQAQERHGRFVDIARRMPLPMAPERHCGGHWRRSFGLAPTAEPKKGYLDARVPTATTDDDGTL